MENQVDLVSRKVNLVAEWSPESKSEVLVYFELVDFKKNTYKTDIYKGNYSVKTGKLTFTKIDVEAARAHIKDTKYVATEAETPKQEEMTHYEKTKPVYQKPEKCTDDIEIDLKPKELPESWKKLPQFQTKPHVDAAPKKEIPTESETVVIGEEVVVVQELQLIETPESKQDVKESEPEAPAKTTVSPEPKETPATETKPKMEETKPKTEETKHKKGKGKLKKKETIPKKKEGRTGLAIALIIVGGLLFCVIFVGLTRFLGKKANSTPY